MSTRDLLLAELYRAPRDRQAQALAARRASADEVLRLRELLKKAGEYLQEGSSRWDAFIRLDE